MCRASAGRTTQSGEAACRSQQRSRATCSPSAVSQRLQPTTAHTHTQTPAQHSTQQHTHTGTIQHTHTHTHTNIHIHFHSHSCAHTDWHTRLHVSQRRSEEHPSELKSHLN